MSDLRVTRENIWQYFTESKKSVNHAKCKYCENFEIRYIRLTDDKVYDHFDDHKDKSKAEMRRRMTEIPDEMCFKPYCETCVNLFSEPENYFDHVILEHFEEVKKHEVKKHFSHYFKLANFRINCNLCEDFFEVSINEYLPHHTKNYHPEKLNMQKTDEVGSSKCVPSHITSVKDLWDNFTKLGFFRARCNLANCDFQDYYINVDGKFNDHMTKKHSQVVKLEMLNENDELWKYFYFYSQYVRCVICSNFQCSSNYTNNMEKHIKMHRSENIDIDRFCNRRWIIKYCIETQETDDKTSVQCNIQNCNDKIELEFNFKPFSEHIVRHQPEPSGETPSKKLKEGNSSKDLN